MADGVIEALERGEDPSAKGSEELFAALYDELHRMAERHLRGNAALSLGPTTLLHEAYLDLAARGSARFPDKGHFMAYASRAMRGLIIDYARRSKAQKRGGGALDITLSAADRNVPLDLRPSVSELESLSDALNELATTDAALAQLVDLHFFCGFSLLEIGEARGVSERTVQRDWRKARLLLHALLVEP